MSETTQAGGQTAPRTDEYEGLADQVEANNASITNSLVGVVQAKGEASLTNSVSGGVASEQNLSMTESVGVAVVAGKNVEMNESPSAVIVAGANVDLHEGRTGVIRCQQATVQNGTIGMLIAPQATLGANVKVVMSTEQAVALGAAFGMAAGLVGLLFRRRR